jgi:hypothetical protein
MENLRSPNSSILGKSVRSRKGTELAKLLFENEMKLNLFREVINCSINKFNCTSLSNKSLASSVPFLDSELLNENNGISPDDELISNFNEMINVILNQSKGNSFDNEELQLKKNDNNQSVIDSLENNLSILHEVLAKTELDLEYSKVVNQNLVEEIKKIKENSDHVNNNSIESITHIQKDISFFESNSSIDYSNIDNNKIYSLQDIIPLRVELEAYKLSNKKLEKEVKGLKSIIGKKSFKEKNYYQNISSKFKSSFKTLTILKNRFLISKDNRPNKLNSSPDTVVSLINEDFTRQFLPIEKEDLVQDNRLLREKLKVIIFKK